MKQASPPQFNILFVCGENACRSQMAEAFYNALARKSAAESAGTFPAGSVNPLAVEVMLEAGIDISGNIPKKMDPAHLGEFGRIVSFGCIARAAFPAKDRLEEWLIDDPSGRGIEFFRAVREEIRLKVENLIEEVEGAGPA